MRVDLLKRLWNVARSRGDMIAMIMIEQRLGEVLTVKEWYAWRRSIRN